MTNVKEFHCHMRMNLQPYEENRICFALSMAQERMYNLALLNTEQDIVHKMDFTNIIDLFTAGKKTGKDCSKCFVLRTCNFGFRSHLFLYQKFFWRQFNLKKIPILFQFLRLLYFQKSYMNIRLRFQVGSGH